LSGHTGTHKHSKKEKKAADKNEEEEYRRTRKIMRRNWRP
jgi:hypothetical protein